MYNRSSYAGINTSPIRHKKTVKIKCNCIVNYKTLTFAY